MRPSDGDAADEGDAVDVPSTGAPRVHMNTTIEPSRLAILRMHAQRVRKSLGELIDEYVDTHYPPSGGPSKAP
jgi:hypothetical protein